MKRVFKDGQWHAFPDEATDEQIVTALGGQTAQPAPQQSGWGSALGSALAGGLAAAGRSADVGMGALKALGQDAYSAVTSPYSGPLGPVANYVSQKTGLDKRVDGWTTPTNLDQNIGGWGARAMEAVAPVGEAVGLLPNTARAGAKYNGVLQAAKDIPVDLTAASKPALRAMELQQAGSTPPRAMSRFIQRTTAPDSAPLTYKESRDFSSNLGRLSADENIRMTPPMQKQVSDLAAALNDANYEAAQKAGVGDLYLSATKEYKQALKMRGLLDSSIDVAKKIAAKTLITGAGGLAGYEIYKGLLR